MNTDTQSAPRTGQAAHTPTPWRAENEDVTGERPIGDDGLRFWTIYPDSEQFRGSIARVSEAECIGGITREERDANTAFILRAVNSFDAMRTALELCAKHADFSQCSVDVEGAVDSALALAKGGQP